MAEAAERVVVVGGGLAGLTAACELLEQGANVTILEKNANLGGNSSKATCGIAVAGSALQQAAGVQDDGKDLVGEGAAAAALVTQGAKDVEWLTKVLGVSDELVLRSTPGHSKVARTVGTKTHFPGAVVTYAAIHLLQQVAKDKPDRLEIIAGATVTKLLSSGAKVEGVEYTKGSITSTIKGQVVIATGGFAGDTSGNSLLAKHAPQLVKLPSTNDERANGDGIKLAQAVGAATDKMGNVHVYPTAAVLPGQESAQFKVVISDALAGAGAKLLNGEGKTFVDELAPAEVRTKAMEGQKGPFRLVLAASDAGPVEWLCDFYTKRNVMRKLEGGAAELAKEIGVPEGNLTAVKSGPLFVATVTPALYSTSGGISVGQDQSTAGKVLNSAGKVIEGLYAAGEATAAPFQQLWDKSGVPLLYSIYSGRVAGRAAAAALGAKGSAQDLRSLVISSLTAVQKVPEASVPTQEEKKEEKKIEDMTKEELIAKVKDLEANGAVAAPAEKKDEGIPLAEVAKHNKKEDAWIILFGEVYDVTRWIPIHPGGEQAIMAYMGQDATQEWVMIHKPGTIEKNIQHLTKKGKAAGAPAGGAIQQQAAPADDLKPIEGDGGIPTVFGAIIFLLLNVIKMLLRTIFFTGNFKFNFDNNRNGTIRSAIFLITFIIIHALGNFVDMLGGPNELNGEGWLFDRIHWTGGLGFWDACPASIIEEYLALALLLHVAVALKRSWDISMNYCLYTGRWNMLISGLTVLTFLQKHLQDFRFYSDYDYTMIYPPKYFIAFDGIMHGRVFYELPDSGVEPVKVRDLYTREVALFKDIGTTLLYTACVCVFVLHLCLGWKKLIPAEAMQIPKDHQAAVIYIGWLAASAVAFMYLSVPWYVYFTEPETVAHVAP